MKVALLTRGHIYGEKEKRVGAHIYRSSKEQRKQKRHVEKEKPRVLSQKTRGESFGKDGDRKILVRSGGGGSRARGAARSKQLSR